MDPYYKDLLRSLCVAIICLCILVIVFSFPVPLFKRAGNTLPAAAIYPSTVLTLVNSERLSRGIPVLSENTSLDQAAQLKANDMVSQGYYAHVSPDGKTPLYWLNAVGYSYLNVGENLVVRVSDSNQAVDAWMGSPSHRESILRSDFTETGIAVATGDYQGKQTTYVVELFATPYPRAIKHIAAALPTKTASTPIKSVAKNISKAASSTAGTISTSTTAITTASSTLAARNLSAKMQDIALSFLSVTATTSTTSSPEASTSPSEAPTSSSSEPVATKGIVNTVLVGKNEIITRPETTPSESLTKFETFVYGVTDRIREEAAALIPQ